jgi:3-methyladenine DNA glycosylase AlkD
MTPAVVHAVREALAAAADPVKAPQMQAYMKSAMPYRGVNAPRQRAIWRGVLKAHPTACDELRAAALQLWREARFREERYAAIALTDARVHARCRDLSLLPLVEEMIVTGAWWDYVDALATHHLGDILRAEPRRMKPLMRRWAKAGESMWKRRAAILSQIRFKGDTDRALLYDCIEPNLSHTDFFIRKAIGWALRQYAWSDPREVKRYVAANRARLSPLSVREALKNVGS